MMRLFVNDEGELWEVDLDRLRGLGGDPEPDPEYVAEYDYLADQGWREIAALDVAILKGEVYDMATFDAWLDADEEGNEPKESADLAEIEPSELRQKLNEVHDILTKQYHIKDWYTVEEVAKRVDRSEWQVRKWCRDGRILAKKTPTGDQWLISHEELVRYQNERLRPRRKA